MAEQLLTSVSWGAACNLRSGGCALTSPLWLDENGDLAGSYLPDRTDPVDLTMPFTEYYLLSYAGSIAGDTAVNDPHLFTNGPQRLLQLGGKRI